MDEEATPTVGDLRPREREGEGPEPGMINRRPNPPASTRQGTDAEDMFSVGVVEPVSFASIATSNKRPAIFAICQIERAG